MSQLITVKVVNYKSRNRYIKCVILMETVLEFIVSLKQELDNGHNLLDWQLYQSCYISNNYQNGDSLFVYKINNKIIAIRDENLSDLPHVPRFKAWSAYSLTNWIKSNSKELEKLIKLKAFI